MQTCIVHWGHPLHISLLSLCQKYCNCKYGLSSIVDIYFFADKLVEFRHRDEHGLGQSVSWPRLGWIGLDLIFPIFRGLNCLKLCNLKISSRHVHRRRLRQTSDSILLTTLDEGRRGQALSSIDRHLLIILSVRLRVQSDLRLSARQPRAGSSASAETYREGQHENPVPSLPRVIHGLSNWAQYEHSESSRSRYSQLTRDDLTAELLRLCDRRYVSFDAWSVTVGLSLIHI